MSTKREAASFPNWTNDCSFLITPENGIENLELELLVKI